MAVSILVAAVLIPQGMDYKQQKGKEAVENKYWTSVETRLVAARIKDEEYTKRGLIDPGPTYMKRRKKRIDNPSEASSDTPGTTAQCESCK